VKSFVSGLDTVTQWKEADSADDAMLVAVARSGDSSAFVELSKRHSRRVLHKIYRITNNWQDAEDVLQESLMRAFVHLHGFDVAYEDCDQHGPYAIAKEKRILDICHP